MLRLPLLNPVKLAFETTQIRYDFGKSTVYKLSRSRCIYMKNLSDELQARCYLIKVEFYAFIMD